jgi:hypothetical protein
MLFNLSGCLCAEDSCDLHTIIAKLLIFLHKYLVFVLHPSSIIYIIVWETTRYNLSCSKKAPPLFILLFGTLAVATCPVSKEASVENKLQ